MPRGPDVWKPGLHPGSLVCGNRTIFRYRDSITASFHQVYIPGAYASLDAAKLALRMSGRHGRAIHDLWESRPRLPDGSIPDGSGITEEELKAIANIGDTND